METKFQEFTFDPEFSMEKCLKKEQEVEKKTLFGILLNFKQVIETKKSMLENTIDVVKFKAKFECCLYASGQFFISQAEFAPRQDPRRVLILLLATFQENKNIQIGATLNYTKHGEHVDQFCLVWNPNVAKTEIENIEKIKKSHSITSQEIAVYKKWMQEFDKLDFDFSAQVESLIRNIDQEFYLYVCGQLQTEIKKLTRFDDETYHVYISILSGISAFHCGMMFDAVAKNVEIALNKVGFAKKGIKLNSRPQPSDTRLIIVICN